LNYAETFLLAPCARCAGCGSSTSNPSGGPHRSSETSTRYAVLVDLIR